jgi:hypothetical protein
MLGLRVPVSNQAPLETILASLRSLSTAQNECSAKTNGKPAAKMLRQLSSHFHIAGAV